MTAPRTPALIRAQDKYEDRMKAAGMVQVTVWVPAEDRGIIKAEAERRRAVHSVKAKWRKLIEERAT